MEKTKIENLFNLEETIAKALLKNYTYPWEVINKIGEYIIELGNSLDLDKFEKRGENIWIAKSASISPTANILGPAIIDENAEIRHCAYIRENAIIGKNVVIGNSVEIKNSIIFNDAEIPHFNYVGDSILGYKAHMGAGSIISNLKSDRTPITIRTNFEQIKTNLIKFGAAIGDYVEIGSNSVLNPGSIIGKNATVYPLSSIREMVEENMIYKNKDNIVKKIKPEN